MKSTYITTQVLLACRSKRTEVKKDIHIELQDTINERKRIMERLRSTARLIDLFLKSTKAA